MTTNLNSVKVSGARINIYQTLPAFNIDRINFFSRKEVNNIQQFADQNDELNNCMNYQEKCQIKNGKCINHCKIKYHNFNENNSNNHYQSKLSNSLLLIVNQSFNQKNDSSSDIFNNNQMINPILDTSSSLIPPTYLCQNNFYNNYLYPHKKKFSIEEDEKLKNLVQKFGAKNWKFIASQMPGRNSRQCRDRYSNYLNPVFNNCDWSDEEDKLLADKYNAYGPKWTKIREFFPKRSANNIKNRYNYYVSKKYPTPKKQSKS